MEDFPKIRFTSGLRLYAVLLTDVIDEYERTYRPFPPRPSSTSKLLRHGLYPMRYSAETVKRLRDDQVPSQIVQHKFMTEEDAARHPSAKEIVWWTTISL